MELDHVQLAIPAGSEDVCDTFYVGLLGFTPLKKPDELAGRGGRWYVAGSHQVHLGVDPVFTPATKAHLALRYEDYDELLTRLDAAGVTLTPDTSLPGVTRCYVHDPVGNRLELVKN
jgi:catechol 2,3-dioxygenase-like lactoylglutathione lyase family enzyme